MKKVDCIIRPAKLEEVKDALAQFGVKGMTVTHVIGCGLQGGRTEYYRGTEYNVNLIPKVKIEIVIADREVEALIEKLAAAARTGDIGDGKIFVMDIENAVRIRTGEDGEAAI